MRPLYLLDTCIISEPTKPRLYNYVTGVMLPSFSIICYDDHASWVHGDLRSDLETAGRTLSFVDGMIASIAVANNMILVTRNIDDFQDIPHLMIENWF